MAKAVRSIEEQVEDLAKKQLVGVKYYTKTETINSEIEAALKAAPSKSGGSGSNYPDIKLLLETKTMRRIPVMIEVKGKKGDFVRLTVDGEIDNKKKDGTENFTNINKYAVNGAVHYANAIVEHTASYKEVIAIGINGYYDEGGALITEIGVYYISLDNFCIPKPIGNYSDLSFLLKKNQSTFIDEIDKAGLTEEEIETKAKEYENQIEVKLKKLNQTMQDTLKISVGSRVELVTGMIMAGLGTDGVSPLEIAELKGETGAKTNDGRVLINKIDSFLEKRSLPQEKKEMIVNDLSRVFVYSDLWKPVNGESKLKSVYTSVKNDIMPIFTSAKHLDFTGKLFNVLNAWVDIPDSDKNDVVLTPRYVTELMAKLALVNKDSYVWDYAVGSAGFLISSMKLMIKDAEERIHSPKELADKIIEIKTKQLLGIEKRSDIYLLAVLNMILMGDGSSNIIHKDSLTEYDGKYEQGEMNGKDFPANVFLLNPPYSAPGKGFVFVKKALSKMSKGKAAILIQENAGSGNGLPYTKDILNNHTLLASIHMADIFKGKAGVQTAIYVFDVGTPHNEKQIVKFIDFSNDGYTRQNRKKSSQDANLKNTDNALERYEEIVNLVLYGKAYLHYFTEEQYIEDTISLEGNDWTFSQHIKLNTIPTEDDFRATIKEYLGWKVSAVLRGEIDG
ncbi:MAG: N-6 DNA methylase [Clostridia bacterium]|nr:N-6 DNA methylase [Clostridia bacterium]